MADPTAALAPADDPGVDWSLLMKSMKNSAQKTQDTGLPSRDAIKLYPFKPLLKKNDDNFEDWHAFAMNALWQNGLHRMVETTCPRPTTGDHTSDWFYTTQLVQAWLGRSIEPALLRMLTYGDDDTLFADNFMKHLRNHFRGQGLSAHIRSYRNLDRLQRVDFGSTKEYINKVIEYHKRAEDVGMKIYPYNLVIKVIIQLQQIPHLRPTLDVLKFDFEKDSRNDIAETMTQYEFRRLMRYWLSEIDLLEEDEV